MKKKQQDQQEKTTIVALVDTFQNATGMQLIQEGVKWVATGAFMGTSDAIPGYSGGTTLALLGFFRKLILVAKSIFIPEPGITRLKALMFFIPFAFGWVAGVFGFAKLTELMASHDLGLELIFFFSPFILFTIPIFLKHEKPDLTVGKKPIRTTRWIWFGFGFLVILAIGIYVAVGTPGMDFSEHPAVANAATGNLAKVDVVYHLGQNLNWLKLIGVAMGAGMLSLIPGGSGALLQFMSGMYKNIHWHIMAHVDQNIGSLFIFAFATLAGMLIMVFVMAWGLKKHKHKLAALSLGMLIASIGVMFMVPKHTMWGDLDQLKHYIGIPLAIILGSGSGLSLHLYINWREKRKKPSKQVSKAA